MRNVISVPATSLRIARQKSRLGVTPPRAHPSLAARPASCRPECCCLASQPIPRQLPDPFGPIKGCLSWLPVHVMRVRDPGKQPEFMWASGSGSGPTSPDRRCEEITIREDCNPPACSSAAFDSRCSGKSFSIWHVRRTWFNKSLLSGCHPQPICQPSDSDITVARDSSETLYNNRFRSSLQTETVPG